jgi:hypothetical protein
MIDVVRLALEILTEAAIPAYAELPEKVGRPVLRIEESGGELPNSLQPENWIRQDLQLDGWGTSKSEARALIGDAYEALRAGVGTHSFGTLRRCETLGGFVYERDEDWPIDGRPGPRYILTVRLTARS